MTEKEMLKVYKQAFDDIADYCGLSQFQRSISLQDAYKKVREEVSLTENQKNVLHDQLNTLTSVTCHNYDYIETKNEPILHTRLYHTSPYEGERYDTIVGYIVSFQAEKLKDDKKYSIKELLNEYI